MNFHEEKAQPPICTDTNQALQSHVSIAAGLTRPSTATGQRAPCAPRRPQSCPLRRAPLHPASSSHMSPHVVGVTGASPRRTASADRRPASRAGRGRPVLVRVLHLGGRIRHAPGRSPARPPSSTAGDPGHQTPPVRGSAPRLGGGRGHRGRVTFTVASPTSLHRFIKSRWPRKLSCGSRRTASPCAGGRSHQTDKPLKRGCRQEWGGVFSPF